MKQNEKIDRSQIEEIIALTSMQEGMLFHYLKEPENDQYFEQLSLKLLGTIDRKVFEKSWEFVTSRNEMLRTFFRWEKIQNPVQIILKCYKAEMKFYDFSNDDISLKAHNLQEVKEKDKKLKFDLRKVPLRITLCKVEEQEYEMIISNHHILFDGWSTGIILKEFLDIYDRLSNNETLKLPLKTKFKEFIKHLNNKDELLEQEYWKRYLNGYEEVHLISEKIKENSNEGMDQYSFRANASIKNDIDLFVKNKRITLAELIYCAWGILLQKYTNSSDVIFGTTLSGRNPMIKGIEDMVGLFINTVPIRIKNSVDESILDLLYNVKNEIQERETFQNTSLVDIKKYLGVDGRRDLFDSLVVVENYPIENFINREKHYLTLSSYEIQESTNYPIVLAVNSLEFLTFTLTYNKTYFTGEQIAFMSEHFVKILENIIYYSKGTISNIEILSDVERKKILYEFNDTYVEYPRDKTINELFEEQVEKTPDNIAVVFEDKELTYRELNERANKLARTLREKGVKADSIVGIMVERSLEMVVGIMGILKAGGSYLPIEPEYPEDRKKYMFYDSKINILLIQNKLADNIEFDGEMIGLEDEEVYSQNGENLENINISSDLAYVIYTSGSTGKPKGVMIEHKSLVNYVFFAKKKYLKDNENIFPLYTSFSFDLTITSIFVPLIFGGKIVAYFPKDENNISIIDILKKSEVSIIKMTPAHLELIKGMENKKSAVKTLIIGGENLKTKLASEVYESFNESVDIYNEYGPTEATVGCIVYKYDYEIDVMKSVLIGKPADNVKIYILDKFSREVPQNVPGEIYISGDGLARGYLNRPELTAEKFIDSPFVSGERMYKTGDLARWIPDGNIEFLGRIDHQVKIRGFRIELGEIESHLLNYETIKEIVVIDREDQNGAKYLCAYLVSENELTVGELREYLSRKLPDYMIPSYFVQLEKIPLTPNGKIDRKALLQLDGSIVTGAEYESGRNDVEKNLVEIWKDVLEAERVGINDNFFELGGHSLKATILVLKIHKELNIEVPLREIFKFPTIKGISQYIESTEKSIYSSIEIVEEKEYYEASSAQKRMYMLQQFDLKSTGYNMPGVMLIEGSLEVERLEKSFTELIKRHETLRTSFETIEDKIIQRVNKSVNFKLNYFEAGCMESTDKVVNKIVKDFVKAFDLNKAPLLRVGLIKLEKDKHILMFDMHHIISDGVSMGILINEFAKIYEGNKLDQLKIQYKDYSQWQNNLLKSDLMQEQKEYWINRFKDELPVLNMPTDFQRPLMQSFEGASINFKLDKELTSNLNKIAKETGSTMYMVLLSGVNILLSKYSGQEDIVIGSPIAGRPHADLGKIIGMFVNTLAMRNYPEGSKIYEEFLRDVKENALRAYENQDYQFEELVEKLNIRRDISRNPLFDVMFTMQNMDASKIELENLKFVPYKSNDKIAKFDLTFIAIEIGEELSVDINYCTKLFKRETVERIVEHFKNILKAVSRNTNIKLNEIEMISQNEKNKLLYDFNDTDAYYPRNKTLHQLFEEQVEKTPDNVAVVFELKKLTYRELNEKSNRLARTLREKGVKPDSIVGIMVNRSLEMIVGIIAILKAGGAYLPIDPDYPEDRVKYMLEDSKTNILLTENLLANKVAFNGEIIILENEKKYSSDIENLQNINIGKDLAYVIYTSGSTGRPKGVMIEHGSVAMTLQWRREQYKLSSEDTVLQLFSNAFDGFVTSFYTPIISGSKVVILSDNDAKDVFSIKEKLLLHKITHFIAVPSMCLAIMEQISCEEAKNLRIITLAGENVTSRVIEKCKSINKNMELVNEYGPTENSVVTTIMRNMKVKNTISIGKPKDNTQIYILSNKALNPIGIVGEICISGEGLARGYLNNEKLTTEKFVENPFIHGKRMYRTGDLGRWLPDGNIEFIGRMDHQVKIRGFRIELQEIENQILNNEWIKETIVIDREDKNGVKYLCAYIVSDKQLTVGELREYLSKELPEYMIPSYFIQLKEIPVTPNGKVDRKALPEPDGNIVTGIEYEKARNKAEEKLVEIWNEVLGIKNIGINHNFFDLGGHSLKATSLVSKIRKELNVEVSIMEIFKSPTIKGISEYIQSTEKNIYEEIRVIEEKEYYEASSAQKRMYMLQHFDLKSTSYNMPGVLEVEGNLDVQRLEFAFNKLVKRYETLRTSFENIEGKIVQKVSGDIDFKVAYIDVRKTIEEAASDKEILILDNNYYEKRVNEEIEKLINGFVSVFDLSKAPLLRVGVIRVQKTKHIIMFDMHHIISDGVSMGILTKEFTEIYDGRDLEEVKVQYKDFSAWQNNFLKSEKMKKQEEYWLQRFNDEIPVLNMPSDFARPSLQNFEGDNVNFKLDKELTSNLNKVAKETGSTMYMVLLSGVNILLSKYSGQEDIIIGSPIAGRPHADLEKIIGMFVNTLAMRNFPKENKSYNNFLKEVKENALKAYENQGYQFEELVDRLNIRRDISRNPLFDVMFTMQNIDSSEIELGDLRFIPYENNNKVAKFDLTFTAIEIDEEILVDITYCTRLFKQETIEKMVEHFKNILKLATKNTSIKLSEIDMLSEDEKNKLLYEFNDTYVDYPRDKTIHQIFEEQVERTPNNIAVVFEDNDLTYRELNEKSNQIARTLREKGVKQDSIVGLMVQRSLEMIIGIMGILKAGGAYLPIDPEYPEDRVKYMLEDSKADILLTQYKFLDKVLFNGSVIDLENENEYMSNTENLESISESKDLAYVIYTSGSTGKPKGVMVENYSVVNRLMWMQKKYPINSDDVILQKTTYTFDVSVWELIWWSLVGAKVCMLEQGKEKSPKDIIEIIKKEKVTTIHFVPSMFNIFIKYVGNKNEFSKVKTLKWIFSSGEALGIQQVMDFNNIRKEYDTELINLYGPTEATVDVTYFDTLKGDYDKFVPIGKPIDNTSIYILDKHNKVQAIGIAGELCIGGVGVARGYLNRLELTAEKFVENPFIAGEKMYKTGDLARWLPDGNIEYLGRIDHQVKIRGFRIELGEIENQLLNYEAIKEAMVIDKEDKNGDKYLCAYLVCDKEVTVNKLREHLLKNLPVYMVPSYFIQLEKMPLTSNGKTDRKALPEPDGNIASGTEYEAARNEVEKKMVQIWREVLSVEKIGINDNFFELGGHSLKATSLLSKIHKELNVEVPLKEIFKLPTIKGISDYIQRTEKNIYQEIKIVEEKEYYEVSSAQKRMYMLQQFDLQSTSYNMPGVLEVEGNLDVQRLEDAFNKLIKRHETLRTSFKNIDGKIVQTVSSDIDFKIEYVDIRKTIEEVALDKDILSLYNCNYEKVINEEMEKLINDFVSIFDLSKAPLLRVGVIKIHETEHIIMFDMHHIISDGISMGILTKEFTKLYDGRNLEQVKVQYKDFSVWQNDFLKSEKMKKQEGYWLQKFSDEIPVLNMPIDFARPSIQSFEGESIRFKLDKEFTIDLNKVAKETESTMYMVLLSGVSLLLSKYSGQEDIVIGSPIAGRPHADLEKIIGIFVNTLAMRNHPEGSKKYKDFLKEVKENALRAYENQDYQFEELVEKLNIRRDISRNPLFDVMFTMQNMDSSEIELKDLKFVPYKNNNKIAKFDLTFTATEIDEEILVDINYCIKLFKRETVERIIGHFKNILKAVVGNTNIKLSDIEMLSEEEKNKLLYEFNDTCADYPRNKTIHQLFEEQVEKTPDNVAIVFEGKKLTYRELNERSNRLANSLREKGVKSDIVVGIMVERSPLMIVGIIAILKAGGAYLPIDPGYPEDRIRYTLADSKTNILLTQSNLINKVPFKGVVIDLEDEAAYAQNIKNLDYKNEQKDLAYIIYTSGTTGKPKGTMIEHKNVVRLMFNNRIQFDFNEKDVWTMFHSYCFDFSVWEMYGALLYGGKLILISKNEARDTAKYLKLLKEEKVTVLNQIPTPFYSLMNKEFESSNNELKLRYVIFGGEALKPEMLRSFMKKYPKTKIINMYGITETTVHVTFKEIKEQDINLKISNIGKPIPTLFTYIMDKNLRLQPIGVPGELCVGGDGVARGYLNKSELTEAKFVTNPYKVEEKIYRSGDLARILSNGDIEYLGRIDHQVKIRGFRIELGEIENQLLNYEAIKESIVIDREDKNGDKYLCAYVVCHKEVTIGKLREYLLKNLPEYMVPSYFIQLEKMPITSNGKVDRKALPEPDGSIEVGTEYEGPRNEVEEKLIDIWSEVLAIENIGINHNFFDLGGHSLKATTLVSKIHKNLNVEVPLKEIFKTPTIKGISEYIQNTEVSIYSSIEKAEDNEYYQVSSAQKRMYMLQQFDIESTVYNMPKAMTIEGKLDVQRLENAFGKLIKRHETLRTSFETIDGEITQIISKDIEFKVEYTEKDSEYLDNIVEGFIRPFDLSKATLLRVGLIKLKEDKHLLMYDMHHIISDGVSVGILINEFTSFYEGKHLDKLRMQYKDFSVWQNKFLKSEKIKEQEGYWLEKFSDEIPVLNMPIDFKRPPIQSFEGDSINFKLDKEITRELNKIAKETGSTMYMVLLSGVNILLSKYSGQEDIIVGSPIAGRPHADLEKIIGMFVNTLAMRNYPKGSKSYEEFLKEVRENSLIAYENQEYQFEELINNLNIRRDISRNPLFDVMFTIQNMDSAEIELENLKFVPYKNNNKVAKFDLNFTAVETGEEILLNIDYCTKLFKQETVQRMVKHFKNILKSIAKNTKIKLSEVEMLSEKEKNKLLYEFNDTYFDNNGYKTIHQLFEEQARKTPNSIAIVYEDKKLTYGELNEKSNSLARILINKGIKSDNSIVGIMVERSLDMIIGIMAVLKAGGAYLPIDPDYPEERKKYMLEDSNTKILLTQEHLIADSVFIKCLSGAQVLNLEAKELYEEEIYNLENKSTSSDLAYVIYTSGSTGRPKGVMVEHRNVTNLIFGLSKVVYGGFDGSVNVSMVSPYYFDASVKQIFPAITLGHTLFIVPKDVIFDGTKLYEFYARNSIKIADGTPVHMSMLCGEICEETSLAVKHFLIGGDMLTSKLANEFFNKFNKSKSNIINVYGPTECCDVTTTYIVDRNQINNVSIPIGKPLANTKVYILDKNLNICPIGVPGELYISGEGITRGYLNNEKLTMERFIESPFIKGEKMYSTGDLARWLEDGNVECLGRIDNQVKIRGFRIELGEIENVLLTNEHVKETIVINKQDDAGVSYLCAYVVCDKTLTVAEFREYLLNFLPDYMIPAYFVYLDEMPLTSNGKIDKKALLSAQGFINIGNNYQAPRNNLEGKLVNIWQRVLGVNKVGICDDFFELGGHSLNATILVARIHKELNLKVSLKEIFKNRTIKELSEYMKTVENNIYTSIGKVEEKEYYEASSAQKRMYILQQMNLEGTVYNMPLIMEVEGNINKELLEYALMGLINRHETLRTSFETIGDKIVQKINKPVECKLEYIDLNDNVQIQQYANSKDNEQLNNITVNKVDDFINEFVRPFDLSKTPLVRMGLIKLYENKHILMFDIHHIISDGVSMGILIDEFTKLYAGKQLEPLKIQYKDYANWQNELVRSETMKVREKYWLDKFSGEIPILNIHTDFARPSIQSFEGDKVSFKLHKDLTEKLRGLCRETGTTMYMVLLSATNILFSKYSEQEDIIIGSPIAGRPHSDLEKIIGMFINTLAMRSFPTPSKTYIEFLSEVSEDALKAYENQDYQFEELIEKLNLRRDISRNPLFDVMFNMHNTNSKNIEQEGLVFNEYKNDNIISKFDISIEASELEEEICLDFIFSVKLFKKETIERMIKHFKNILDAVVENRYIQLSKIDMIEQEEKEKILGNFNNTYESNRKDVTIHELFEEQVRKTPNSIAVVYEDRKLTYEELNQRSNSLARILINKGIKSGNSIVGIMVERSLDMIVGIMATLKAGCAYLPIDPDYPEERKKYMLEDSDAKILLTQEHLLEGSTFIKSLSGVEALNLEAKELYEEIAYNLENKSTSSDLAYVIYTSGSTGRPKGVMVEHRNVTNLIFGLSKVVYSGFDGSVNVSMVSPYYFDASVKQIFPAITLGHTLFIVSKDVIFDGTKLYEFYAKNSINIADGTPVHMSMLCSEIYEETPLAVKHFLIGGDMLTSKLANEVFNKFNKSKPNIINVYGPTECCDVTTTYIVDRNQINDVSIPIGKPLANTKVYILDKNLNICPIGVPGEMYISGKGVTRGYLNNKKLTMEKFIENPFIKGQKMYSTGDLAIWLEDGNIECLGRIDNQVKIRGFRIELGEIENVLLTNENVKEAIVINKQDDTGFSYLCAYVVCDKALTVAEFREYLLKYLPDYMIPAYFVYLDEMPLTANAKIDKRVLPEPNVKINTGVEYAPARNEVEKILVDAWTELFRTEKIGIKDSFFELGGDSIKAIQLVSKIKKYGYTLDIKELFRNPYIESLSKYVKREVLTFEQEIIVGEVELTPIQRWLFEKEGNEIHHWNQAVGIYSKNGFEEDKLRRVFDNIVLHHDALRMVYDIQGFNESVNADVSMNLNNEKKYHVSQFNKGKNDSLYALEIFDFRFKQDYEKEIEVICNKMQSSMDLKNGPLVKLAVFKTDEGDHLLMAIHHLVIDGVSWRIILEDFREAYKLALNEEKIVLQSKTTSYRAWAKKLKEYSLDDEEMKYWGDKEKQVIKSLPKDFVEEDNRRINTEAINISLTEEETEKLLKEVNKSYNTEINDILLTALGLTISEWTKEDKTLINLESHGREHGLKDVDISRTVGWFTVQYPVILDMSCSQNLSYKIKNVKEQLRTIPNKGFGYGILKYLNRGIELKLNPEISFNYLGQVDEDLKTDIFENSILPIGDAISKNNMMLYAIDIGAITMHGKLNVQFTYNKKKYMKSTIEKLAQSYKSTLCNIINNCVNQKETQVTPSDLGSNKISVNELEQYMSELNDMFDDFEE